MESARMNGLIAGSRGSNLALKQTQTVIDLLKTIYPPLNVELKIIKTKGDHIQDSPLAKIGGKGLFTKELEQNLLEKHIDFAVHSLKDLPVQLPSGLAILAYIKRECAQDVLISKENKSLREIPHHGVIATGSLRRKFQLLQYREDLHIVDVRGNIETRIEKLYKHDWDGLILAYAALQRLGKTELISEIIPEDVLYPAVGQGIIAVECREEPTMRAIFAAINDRETEMCAMAERAFLQGLGGGCQVPVGVISKVQNAKIHLSGIYMPEDGKYCIKEAVLFDAGKPDIAGAKLAEKILAEYQKRKT
jgi:hydroxymethylbilane synthase